jgi:FkbM family methyltransferase
MTHIARIKPGGSKKLPFQLLRFLERLSAYFQGKGYGSATIKQEVALLQSFLSSPPQLAVDIGGNVGNYTAEIRRLNPNAEIHTFEPSSTNLTKLQARFASDSKITILPFAVSETEGAATLFSNEPGSGLGSLTQRKLDHFNIPFDTKENVSLIRFEDYWKAKLSGRHIDLLKLDIEGHELSALRGFGQALDNISVIQFEFGGCNIDTRTFFQDFWYFFTNAHFQLYRITPIGAEHIDRYRERDEFFSTTNFIAVKKH